MTTDFSDDPYPSFDGAEKRFKAFLRDQGHPVELLYVGRRDVISLGKRILIRPPRSRAARRDANAAYDAAVTNGLGVSLTGLCALGGRTCVHVAGPRDQDEAERLMYPDGLKLSVRIPLRNAVAVGPVRGWLLRMCARLSGLDKLLHEFP